MSFGLSSIENLKILGIKYMKSKSVLTVCLILTVMFFCGCSYKYTGDYPDLYSVAINSILWNNGHSYGADRAIDAEIDIIEKDDYGRTLYTYYEKYYAGAEISFSALLIAQSSADGYIYFYEDYNFIIKKQELYSSNKISFTQEEIDNIKTLNDWNKELNLEKCIKKVIAVTKCEIPYEVQTLEEKIIDNFDLGDKNYNLFIDYLTDDNNGNFIIYGSIIKFNAEDIYFAAIVNSAENKIAYFVPENIYNYREEFITFKTENGWKN